MNFSVAFVGLLLVVSSHLTTALPTNLVSVSPTSHLPIPAQATASVTGDVFAAHAWDSEVGEQSAGDDIQTSRYGLNGLHIVIDLKRHFPTGERIFALAAWDERKRKREAPVATTGEISPAETTSPEFAPPIFAFDAWEADQ
ncbi:hypothetical protein L218DRAFT_992634 [Marasmius fiardii PR-910]|nr:hypothetical protein L218DRAFT_992634 [Marasmius fiardii PR-910]